MPLVLILVLVEDGLRPNDIEPKTYYSIRLNPCFSGRWSATKLFELAIKIESGSLNPCFSGRWSSPYRYPYASLHTSSVFIPFLVEACLRQCILTMFFFNARRVLLFVVVRLVL